MSRFGGIDFNLMRAIELFQDLNVDDMDVTAPGSDENYSKETEVAMILNKFLGQLIQEGLFDDCKPRRAVEESDEEKLECSDEDEESVFENSLTEDENQDEDEQSGEEEDENQIRLDYVEDGDKDDEDGYLKFFSKKIDEMKSKQIASDGAEMDEDEDGEYVEESAEA